eukprot:1394496-Amphidinium_carterae.2
MLGAGSSPRARSVQDILVSCAQELINHRETRNRTNSFATWTLVLAGASKEGRPSGCWSLRKGWAPSPDGNGLSLARLNVAQSIATHTTSALETLARTNS